MKRRFLVIDDDPAMCEMLSEIIVTRIFPDSEVLTAGTGEEGIRKAEEFLPTVIILDLMLPNITGYEVCKKLKSNAKTHYIPLIMITGFNNDDELKSKSLNAGAESFLHKPFEISEIIAQLKAMVRIHDAEELLRNEKEILKNKVQLHDELINMNDGIIDWNLTNNIVYYSEECIKLLGLKISPVNPGIDFFYNQIHPDDVSRVKEEIKKYLEHSNAELIIEFKMFTKNKKNIWVILRGQSIYVDDRPVRFIGVIDNITNQKDKENELRMLAHHDTLTGLPNRILMDERLSLSVAIASRKNHITAVLFLDLDGFKAVNDNFGHNYGDILLQQVSKRLVKAVRELDTVARFGGDEFVIILQFIDKLDDVKVIAQRIVDSVARTYFILGDEIKITTSLGISVYPKDTQDASLLLKYADTAMYSAKKSGKNRYAFFHKSLLFEYDQITAIRNNFIKDLETDNVFLELLPVVDVEKRRITYFESLIKWKNKDEIWSCDKFVPIIKSADTGFRLLKKSFGLVIDLIKDWKSRGLNPVISLKISQHEFYYHDFYRYLTDSLEENKISAENIILELTANTIIEDRGYALRLIDKLNAKKFKIILDDFGNGILSFKDFYKLKLYSLKFADEFTKSIGQDKFSENLVKSMIVICKGIGINSVAQNIDSKEQLDFLLKYKIKIMNGNLISPVLDKDSAREIFADTEKFEDKLFNFK
ncbi:MAG: hypothetical protein CSB55_01035 [Candidatus Cloacimonadota bacterium]|nr:MAG: hypothetical protein CSB55_01035 [Candidatus Cloacimonadota bacterium]